MSDFHDKYELLINEKLNLYNIKYNEKYEYMNFQLYIYYRI